MTKTMVKVEVERIKRGFRRRDGMNSEAQVPGVSRNFECDKCIIFMLD